MAERVFGDVAGVEVGTEFANRESLRAADVHRPLRSGISYSAQEGADSIVVSGGYEDDEDYGDIIVYTGHGGRDPSSVRQIADQELERGNLALARNAEEGLPVRVVRGADGDPTYSPTRGYRYDGLYSVDHYWSQVGHSGFRVWRYRLIRIDDPLSREDGREDGEGPSPRAEITVQRIVRNTQAARRVKALHEHTCQICGRRVETAGGPYAEGAHVRPLGRPHDGPDGESNILCLCPNCHVRFDQGGLWVSEDGVVVDAISGEGLGALRRARGHTLDPLHFAYHRELWL